MKSISVSDFISDSIIDSNIKVICLNRPQVKNAFHPEMIQELTEVFLSLSNQKDIKAILLKGAGTSFCAGADLNWMKEMVKYSFDENKQDSYRLWDMFEAILKCECPVIGLIHGAVYGGALGLVACCDYVIADVKTQYCFSEVKLGLAPAVISSFVLNKISAACVRPYMLTAQVFNNQESLRMGLVHEEIDFVSSDLAFEKIAENRLRCFSANGLTAMRETKKLIQRITDGASWKEQKELTTDLISQRRVSEEAQMRLKSFLEKKV
jgi:methylglutaconyl-CoA hydratase